MQPVRKADNPATLMELLSRNSGSLKLLEPSGPVQGYTGMDLRPWEVAYFEQVCLTIY